MERFLWAKKFDEVAHIVNPASENTGVGVYCGKYGALLGNNYAPGLTEICPICEQTLQDYGKHPEDFRRGDQCLVYLTSEMEWVLGTIIEPVENNLVKAEIAQIAQIAQVYLNKFQL